MNDRCSLPDSCRLNVMNSGAIIEVDALVVITISRGCFERCGSNKKTPPYIAPTYSNLRS